MAILLTNDDGIDAPGIRALTDALSDIDTVYVVAPHVERSGCSHSVLIGRTFGLTDRGNNRYALESTPADCVRAALSGLITGDTIDLVVSGINRGLNAGYDVHYSGTVAAVREALIEGVSGIAFSLDNYLPTAVFDEAARIARSIVVRMRGENAVDAPFCLNVNIPDVPLDRVSGVRVTTLAHRTYEDSLSAVSVDGPRRIVEFRGEIPDGDRSIDTDFGAVKAGYVSVTPLSLRYAAPAAGIAAVFNDLIFRGVS
ncbi:MAG: 5'/3'-nucleotidase SurE [Spirochaetota bacterium]